MILRNWYNAYKAMVTRTAIENGIRNSAGSYLKASYANLGASASFFYFGASSFSTSIGTANTIVVGSGATAPTYDDYKLERQITSGLSGSVLQTEGCITLNITNTGASPVTIAEVGIYGTVYYAPGSTGHALVERSTFTPITLQPGEIGQIIYNFDMNIPE